MTQKPNVPPYELFHDWLKTAEATEPNDPTAACLATVSADGWPNARMVLVRTIDVSGFVFFTNEQSQKGRELLEAPRAALCFHWKTQHRQIRVQGTVTAATAEESDRYFNSRHPLSRIGAWASLQSQELEQRTDLLERFDHYKAEYPETGEIPRPPHWHGFRISPTRIEFWKEGDFRLHERLLYVKNGTEWETTLLYP